MGKIVIYKDDKEVPNKAKAIYDIKILKRLLYLSIGFNLGLLGYILLTTFKVV